MFLMVSQRILDQLIEIFQRAALSTLNTWRMTQGIATVLDAKKQRLISNIWTSKQRNLQTRASL